MHARLNIREVIASGWAGATRNLLFFIGLCILLAVVVIGMQLVIVSVAELPGGDLWSSVAVLCFFAAQWALGLGLIRIALQVADKKPPSLALLFSQYMLLSRYFLAVVVYSALVFLGLLAFIVPGIIIAVMFGFFPYALVDRRMGVLESLAFSKKITRGNLWRLVWLFAVLYVIQVAGILFFGVGIFIAVPLAMVAVAAAYRDLADQD